MLSEASRTSQGRTPKSSPLRLGIGHLFNMVPGVITTVKAIMWLRGLGPERDWGERKQWHLDPIMCIHWYISLPTFIITRDHWPPLCRHPRLRDGKEEEKTYHKVRGYYLVVYHVVRLLSIGFTQQSLCRFSKSTMKHLQKPDWKSDLVLIWYGYHKCMFVDFLIGYMGSSKWVHYWM